MQEYIIRKDGDDWLAVSPSGAETGPFDTHEEALEEIAQDCIEADEECRLLFDDGSGELQEIPNWSPERFIEAGAPADDDDRVSVRRRRRNVRKSNSGRSRSRRRRSSPRGGHFDFRSYMNSAQQVRENLGQLFFAREPDEV